MSREIKFRAWDNKKGKMYPVNTLGIFDNISWAYSLSYLHNTQEWYGEEGMVKNPILMQYTGLKDKNGVEIYEGDIVTYKAPVSKMVTGIICQDLYFNTAINVIKIEDRKINEIWHIQHITFSDAHCEIIGNIHQNKELL